MGRFPLNVREVGSAVHASDAVQSALRNVASNEDVVAAGIDAPLFWVPDGSRHVDDVLRQAIVARSVRDAVLQAQPGQPRVDAFFIAVAKPAAVKIDQHRRRLVRPGLVEVHHVPFVRTVGDVLVRRLRAVLVLRHEPRSVHVLDAGNRPRSRSEAELAQFFGFVRYRYAEALRHTGRAGEAEAQMQRATELRRAAQGG